MCQARHPQETEQSTNLRLEADVVGVEEFSQDLRQDVGEVEVGQEDTEDPGHLGVESHVDQDAAIQKEEVTNPSQLLLDEVGPIHVRQIAPDQSTEHPARL